MSKNKIKKNTLYRKNKKNKNWEEKEKLNSFFENLEKVAKEVNSWPQSKRDSFEELDRQHRKDCEASKDYYESHQ